MRAITILDVGASWGNKLFESWRLQLSLGEQRKNVDHDSIPANEPVDQEWVRV